jgi:hypothetical protein
MNLIDKTLYTWHLMKSRHYEALVNDCLSTSLQERLRIKATYHRELSMQYTENISSTEFTGY